MEFLATHSFCWVSSLTCKRTKPYQWVSQPKQSKLHSLVLWFNTSSHRDVQQQQWSHPSAHVIFPSGQSTRLWSISSKINQRWIFTFMLVHWFRHWVNYRRQWETEQGDPYVLKSTKTTSLINTCFLLSEFIDLLRSYMVIRKCLTHLNGFAFYNLKLQCIFRHFM